MNITLKQVEYFIALVRERNFGRAAGVMNISQPALSVQIKELEDRLGAQLVERQSRDVVPTPFGRMILDHCQIIQKDVRALEEAARWRGGVTGKLNLGLIPTIAPYIVTDVIAAIGGADLSLDLQIHEGKTETLITQLRNGLLDAAVVASPVPMAGFHFDPLFNDYFLLAGTEHGLRGLPEELSPNQLGDAQLILLEDGHCLTDQALELCGRDKSHAQINFGAASMATLTQLVGAGFGLTLMPEIAAPFELSGRQSVRLRRFSGVEPMRQIGMLRRETSLNSDWGEALCSVLAQAGQNAQVRAREMLKNA